MAVFRLQCRALDVLHEADDEVACPDERINDMHTYIRQRPIKLGFQDVCYAIHHKIDDRLWCIDDTVCVCYVFGESLKEFLVERIEEVLFLGEVFAECRCLLNCDIERVQSSEECVAAYVLPHQHVADIFNLACNDVSTGKIRSLKNGAEDPFSEDMLDEHLLDGIL